MARVVPTCSFCGKSQDQVSRIIGGPGVFICYECIDLCNEIIGEELAEQAAGGSATAEKKAGSDKVEELLATLSVDERRVVILRFGLDRGEPRRLDEVGVKLGLTRDEIRGTEREAFQKLGR